MKRTFAILALLFVAGISIDAEDIDTLFSGDFGALPYIIQLSSFQAGSVSFEKKDDYLEFGLTGSGYTIKVLIFARENKELIWVSATSEQLSMGNGIKVGSNENEVAVLFGKPIRSIQKGTDTELDYFGKQYGLMVVIAKG